MSEEQIPCQNTDETLYREKHSDHWGSFDDKLFVTKDDGIGIDVAGMVYVKPLKQWHSIESKLAIAVKALEKIAGGARTVDCTEQSLLPYKMLKIASAALAEINGK